MGPAGLVAILAGWLTTEIGRQPWVVYGVHAHQRRRLAHHSALALSATLMVFVVMYFAVFGTGISYMLKLVAQGPRRGRRTRDAAAQAAASPCARRGRFPRLLDIDPAMHAAGQRGE